MKIQKELTEAKNVEKQLSQLPSRSVGDIKRVTQRYLSILIIKKFSNKSDEKRWDEGVDAGETTAGGSELCEETEWAAVWGVTPGFIIKYFNESSGEKKSANRQTGDSR